MCDVPSEYMFANFAKKATLKKSDGTNGVSDHWSNMFESLYSNKYSDMDINKLLSSHCQKKFACQQMADGYASALAIVFRVGWNLRNESTLFDYIYQKANLTSDGGKVLSGWNYKYGNIQHGGYSPDISDIPGDDVIQFAQRLFIKHPNISIDIKKLLASSVLRFYDKFKIDIECEPLGKYMDRINDHPFFLKIEYAKVEMDITDEIFKRWKALINKGFKLRNMAGMY